jgi:pyruvate ferredoxin oxidoreductase gamma subunit
MHCPVLHPQFVGVVDATLIDSINVIEGATKNASIVVNTSREPSEIRAKLNAEPGQKVFTIDATKIALDCIGRAMPNAPMLGAVTRITGLVSLEHLLEDVKNSFGKKFSQKIIDGNIEAAKRGYEEVKEG